MLLFWYAYSAASDPDKLPYDLSFWRAGASVVGTALSGWFTHRRSKAALPVAGVTAVSTVALGALNKRLKGAYVTRTWRTSSPKETVFNRIMPVAHAVESLALVGLGAANRVKARKNAETAQRKNPCDSAQTEDAQHGAVEQKAAANETPLSETLPSSPFARHITQAKPLASAAPVHDTPSTEPLVNAPWYPRARKLGLYFMSFSLLGHWVEMAFCMGIKHGIFKGGYDRENHMLWDQWLFPFPAEGTAAVLADLLLSPVKDALQNAFSDWSSAGRIPARLATPLAIGTSFLVNQAVCTGVDYGTGMVANRNFELWDYRDMRFNFQGQVCLQNSLFYSIIATWGVWWLLPQLEKLMTRAGNTVLDGTLVGFGSFFAFLELLYQVLPRDKE